jgi:hypothetical protein
MSAYSNSGHLGSRHCLMAWRFLLLGSLLAFFGHDAPAGLGSGGGLVTSLAKRLRF